MSVYIPMTGYFPLIVSKLYELCGIWYKIHLVSPFHLIQQKSYRKYHLSRTSPLISFYCEIERTWVRIFSSSWRECPALWVRGLWHLQVCFILSPFPEIIVLIFGFFRRRASGDNGRDLRLRWWIFLDPRPILREGGGEFFGMIVLANNAGFTSSLNAEALAQRPPQLHPWP